jgi:hypothetical protein
MNPDITLCRGNDCPLKGKCHRYLAKPTPDWQSYFETPPHEDGKCQHYWPLEKGRDELKAI